MMVYKYVDPLMLQIIKRFFHFWTCKLAFGILMVSCGRKTSMNMAKLPVAES